MDRLDELAVFIAILDAGSLAAAGRRLRRSPPAITRLLAGLEERVGARLFERTTRRLAPTDAGRRFAEQARRLLGDYHAVMQGAADSDVSLHGMLRLTAPVVFGRRHVTPVATSFLDMWPALRIEMLLSDRNLDLIEEGLDVAVRIGRLADSGLMVRRVGEVRRVLVASPAYLAARGQPRHPDDLAGHDIIFTSSLLGPLVWRFHVDGQERAFRVEPRLMVNDIEAKLVAVRAGQGIAAALSYQVVDDLASGTLIRLLEAFESPPLPVQLVVPSVRHMPARVRAFLDHAARQLGALAVLT
ncbi:LysR family transcriptional regulator [Acidiphilium sp. AL]|uniref:LysR family transcriptional regulator n=1 Tax=Acidiphilium iwatense TaxID=768198 RepID=A0ABS9DXX5_9PROT|nr:MULTISPECIES: LysR family transcriptional regulator [Acidiphilium]MCF3947599.1 LysR family transcriptional regulator [Acidiphilium iwatense]MCU4160765.1 LysR family transcriptional regulator [Acidiphilium sp. AL]